MANADDEPTQEGFQMLLTDTGNLVEHAAQVRATWAAHAPGDVIEVSVKSPDGQIFTAGLRLWETVEPALRHAERASIAATTAWSNLVRGEAAAFLN